jgi:hypothetical protein
MNWIVGSVDSITAFFGKGNQQKRVQESLCWDNGQRGIIPKCAKLSPEKFSLLLWCAKVIHRQVDFCTPLPLNTASNLAM